MESFQNGIAFNRKYEVTEKIFRPVKIIVFMNETPGIKSVTITTIQNVTITTIKSVIIKTITGVTTNTRKGVITIVTLWVLKFSQISVIFPIRGLISPRCN